MEKQITHITNTHNNYTIHNNYTMRATSTFLLQSRKRSADPMVAKAAKVAKTAKAVKTVNTAKHSLYEKGYHVVPVFDDPRSVWTKL